MIILYLKNSGGIDTPLKLIVNDITYTYNKDKLFKQLVPYINEKITIKKSGDKETLKEYIIKEVTINEIPTIKLKGIDETV